MSSVALVVVYSLLILVASLAGGWLPMVVQLTHRRLQFAVSFVAGVMLGVGLLHLMPHAWFELGSIDRVAWWMLLGFVAMFFLERVFHYHTHEAPDELLEQVDHGEHGPDCEHKHHHAHDEHCGHDAHALSWTGVTIGLSLHTLADGVALAAAIEAESHGGLVWLAGVGTFLAVVLHKPFDAMAISTLMTAGGWSARARHLVNGLFALMIPLGVLLFHLGATQWGDASHVFLGCALAFSAGMFLCISASDLLPELQFHRHDRVKLSISLLLGLALAWGIGLVESHGHDHHHAHPGIHDQQHGHDDGHAHDHGKGF